MNKQYYKSNFTTGNYLHNTIDFVLDEISDLMKICYGPYGSHVMIANKYGAEAMKDGLGILTSYQPTSSIAKSVHQSILNVSNRQAEEVGDGTTTTILLLTSLYKRFRKVMKTYGLSPASFNDALNKVTNNIKNKIDSYKETVVSKDGSIDWNKVESAVLTSVDGDEDLANIIIRLYKELDSDDPLIIVDTSPTTETRYELVKGLEITGSPVAPEIFFGGYSRKEVNQPNIILINGLFKPRVEWIMDLDNECTRYNEDYVFLFSGIDDDVLGQLVSFKKMNPALLNHIVLFQINMSGLNEEFMDTAAILGATPIDSDAISKCANGKYFTNLINKSSGICELANFTSFAGRFNNPKSNEDRLAERVEEINQRIEDLKKDPSAHNDIITDLEGRRSMLSKNYAKLYVGGPSPQRKSINYELAKDGVLQAGSCIKNGIVSGCNTLIPRIVTQILRSDSKLSLDIILTELDNTKDFADMSNGLGVDIALNIDTALYLVIFDSYLDAYVYLMNNKINDVEMIRSMIHDDIINYGSVQVMNLRDIDTDVCNSAATDKVILDNAIDMASLLATTSGYLAETPEFDPVGNRAE